MAREMTVTAILDANISKFLDGMNAAEGASSRLESNTTKAGGGMFKSFMGAQIGANLVTNAIGMISSGFADITSEMNDNAKAWAMFEGNLKMIGESDREIARVKSSLQDFATETIYSASDMAQTYSQMAAIGVEGAEQLVKGMGGIAASSENPAQAMKSLSTQMVQALSQPEMKWQDFRIMLEQAPAGMAQVAKEMGYELNDLIGAIQDGEVASSDFAKAVAEVGTNADYQAMATEFKTMDQAMDGLTETLANKLAPAFDVVSEIGISAIEGLTDLIDNIDFTPAINSLKRFGTWLGLIDDPFEGVAETIAMTTEELETLASGWDDLTLDEKQAQVNTMGQEDLEELMRLMGVDFDSIPDEYTKNAYMNAYGKDTLEELLWVTGTWHDLTLEEKRAVLEAQIDNDEIKDVIEQRDLWNEAEFISQLAEINMNDSDALQQVENLINEWAVVQGLEPVTLDVDASSADRADASLMKFIERWNTAFKNIDFSGDAESVSKSITTEFEKAFEGFDFESFLPAITWDTWKEDIESFLNWLESVGEAIQTALKGWEKFDNFMSDPFGLEGRNVTDVIYDYFVELNPKVEVGEGINQEELANRIMDSLGSDGLSKKIQSQLSDLGIEVDIDTVKGNIKGYQVFIKNEQIAQDIASQLSSFGIEADIEQIRLFPERYQLYLESLIEAEGEPQVQVDKVNVTALETGMSPLDAQHIVGGMSATVDKLTVDPLDIVLGGQASGGAMFGGEGFKLPAPTIDLSGLQAQVQSGMTAIHSTFQSRMQSIQNNVQGMMGGVNASFSSGMSQAQDTVASGMSAVVSSLNSASSSAYSAGSNVGSSFARGIDSQRGAVMSAAQSIANVASNAIQSALKIASPSKVWTSFGEFSGQGFINGIASMTDLASRTANEFAMATLPDLSDNTMTYAGSSVVSHSIQDAAVNQGALVDALDALQNQPIFIDMDGYLVGQAQRQYNNENLGTDARLTERWAF